LLCSFLRPKKKSVETNSPSVQIWVANTGRTG